MYNSVFIRKAIRKVAFLSAFLLTGVLICTIIDNVTGFDNIFTLFFCTFVQVAFTILLVVTLPLLFLLIIVYYLCKILECLELISKHFETQTNKEKEY